MNGRSRVEFIEVANMYTRVNVCNNAEKRFLKTQRWQRGAANDDRLN